MLVHAYIVTEPVGCVYLAMVNELDQWWMSESDELVDVWETLVSCDPFDSEDDIEVLGLSITEEDAISQFKLIMLLRG